MITETLGASLMTLEPVRIASRTFFRAAMLLNAFVAFILAAVGVGFLTVQGYELEKATICAALAFVIPDSAFMDALVRSVFICTP